MVIEFQNGFIQWITMIDSVLEEKLDKSARMQRCRCTRTSHNTGGFRCSEYLFCEWLAGFRKLQWYCYNDWNSKDRDKKSGQNVAERKI